MVEEKIEKSEEVKAYLNKKERRENIAFHRFAWIMLLLIGLIVAGAGFGILVGSQATQNNGHVVDKTQTFENRTYYVTPSQYGQVQGIAALVAVVGLVAAIGGGLVKVASLTKEDLKKIEDSDKAEALAKKIINESKAPKYCPECGYDLKHKD